MNGRILTYYPSTLISECITLEHLNYIVMFDFCKAFDKTSYQCAINSAASFNLNRKTIEWINSFLIRCTQKMRIGDALSMFRDVISRAKQKSVVGQIFYILLINFRSFRFVANRSFCRRFKIPCRPQSSHKGKSLVLNQ